MTAHILPPLHPDFRYKVDYVGNEKQPVLIIDNFLDKAELMIDVLAALPEFGESTYLYPGLQVEAPQFYSLAIYTHLRHLICKTFNLRLENITSSKSFYAMVLTPPNELKLAQSRPHVDTNNALQLAGVHYLCSAHHGGTSLYRHKASGFELISQDRRIEYETLLEQEAQDSEWKGKYIHGSNKYYEQIGSYDAVFNRLIMYHGNSLHSGNIAPDFDFDPNPRTGRLTLTTFIHSRE
jgi:hypothetical protein